LLFTPPYCPDLQPIELFWAYGKNYVAHNFIQGRLLPDVHQMLIEGLYGMGETATNKVVGKMVNRSNEFVNNDDEEESDEEDTDSDDEDLEGDDEDIEKDGDEDDRE
ncbi:unnamed protein product, partial [Ectocarpus fasciculatus]